MLKFHNLVRWDHVVIVKDSFTDITVICEGKVDTEYDCYPQCWNGTIEKYLWGSSCKARKLFGSTILDGKCGNNYACVTNDIGKCPYNEYCPKSSQGRF